MVTRITQPNPEINIPLSDQIDHITSHLLLNMSEQKKIKLT